MLFVSYSSYPDWLTGMYSKFKSQLGPDSQRVPICICKFINLSGAYNNILTEIDYVGYDASTKDDSLEFILRNIDVSSEQARSQLEEGPGEGRV